MSNNQPQPPRQSTPQQRNSGFESREDNFYEANRFDNFDSDDYEFNEPQGRDSWRDRQSAHIDAHFNREAYWQQGERDRNSGAYGLDAEPNRDASRERQRQLRAASDYRNSTFRDNVNARGYQEDRGYQSQPNYQSQYERYQRGNYAHADQRPSFRDSRPIHVEGQGYEDSRNEAHSRNYGYGGLNWDQAYADTDYASTQRGRGGNQQWGDASPNSRSPYGGSNYRQPQDAYSRAQNNPSYHTEDFTGGGWISYDNSGFNNRGRAPKGYERSDERIHEDICEHLAHDRFIDASDITVTVKAGVVTLEGTINDRRLKHRVEDIADACIGVKDVQNRLSIVRQGRDATTSNSAGTSDSRTNGTNGMASNQPGNEATTGQKITRQ